MALVKYAVINEEGLIGNIINLDISESPEWTPGEGKSIISAELNDRIGDYIIGGKRYPKPRDNWEYSFNQTDLAWVMSDASVKEKSIEKMNNRLNSASDEYNRASVEITSIQQQIDDEDYSDGETEESLTAEKSKWTAYRVKLRAYIKSGDGSKELPVKPDA